MQIVFNILLLTIILYIFWTNIENFEATPPTHQIKEAVKQVYLADVESIRNLSIIAKKLQEDGALVTPTNMSIRGKLNINSSSNAKDLPANITLSVDNQADATIRLKTKADDAKNIILTNNDGNLTMGNAKGADLLNIKADGNVAIKQDLTTGSLTSSTIKAPGAMRIESTAITTTGSLTAGSLTAGSLTAGNLTTSGDIQAQNIRVVNGSLIIDNIRLRDYTPVILTFDARHIGGSNYFGTHEKVFVLQQASIALCLWGEGGPNNSKFDQIAKLMSSKQGVDGKISYRYTRFAHPKESLTTWRGLVVSVPPGKACKIYGWYANERINLIPGYHQLMLPWDPHLVWAGFQEKVNDIPDNIALNTGAGL
jgi:hypothetical protein